MKNIILMAITLTLVLGTALFNRDHAIASLEDGPETVLGTYRVKPGMENELLKLIAEDWSLLRRHELVLSQPHLVLRGEDEPGKIYIVEILSWKNHEAADHVPPDVHAVWAKMGAVTEARGGHQAIEFPEVHVVMAGE